MTQTDEVHWMEQEVESPGYEETEFFESFFKGFLLFLSRAQVRAAKLVLEEISCLPHKRRIALSGWLLFSP
jgi:hypothetical protein